MMPMVSSGNGHIPVDADELYVTRPSLPPLEEFVAEIESLWESHMLTNMGEKHERFERELERTWGTGPCVLFTNGHSALEAVLLAHDLKGEVITTPFTFSSTTHAIVRAGLIPVMCDVRAEDATLDSAAIEPLITERTCAIVPVHVYGNVCEDSAIRAIADRFGLKVIYDAAHVFGERVGGRAVAALGDASILSFHATKVFHSIEGGAVCCNGDKALERRLDLLRNFEDVASAPRLAYLLARSFEDDEEGGAEASERLYSWACDDDERPRLAAALEWYVLSEREGRDA